MSYRDWERGEGNPRERQPIAPWDDLGDPVLSASHSSTDRYRTPSRRRAVERGQEEPVDAYLPRWAVESGIAHADGRGRHAAPDDEDDDAPPVSGVGRRAARRRRESERRETRAIAAAPESDHTREWTFDRPQDQGYVGSRRADTDEGAPVSGAAPTARPRRSPSRRPEVIWSGGDDSDLPVEAVPEQPPRRRRRNTDDSWARPLTDPGSRPASDPWSRSAEPEPEYRPAVDPWDASGVHSWQSPVADDRWERPGGASRWEQSDDTGQWDRFTDTAQWDRTDIGRWGSVTADRDEVGRRDTGGVGRWGSVTADRDEVDRRDTGGIGRRDTSGIRRRDTGGDDRWGRDDADRWDTDGVGRRARDDVDRWERSVPPRSSQPVTGGEGWPWGEQPEGFWSGTRLAGDDPRWMDPPTSAPRSPVVGYTAPRPRPVPRRRAEPASGRSVATAALRDRIGSVGAGSWNRRLEDDLLDPDPGGPLRPLVYTAACYLVPAVLVFLWLLTLDGQPPAGCVTDISGGGCEPPRAHAFGSLVAGAPRFGLSLLSSLVVAVLLRRVGTTWRPATVALAAAVVGGGLSTVLISAITGQPIG
ncbi:hypothetical protein [Micromonospora antibiotica]|uniref:Uncharacterized protein n=1 Tax=Micromonospora antibiotica TaxID=2807623 RepID=A0ABS3V1D6_9ACTN|nr:hypothetical protein [Micromonospora antibiotica]MBO4159430.1 hypothetical protein [Micromonospora antibiotica]